MVTSTPGDNDDPMDGDRRIPSGSDRYKSSENDPGGRSKKGKGRETSLERISSRRYATRSPSPSEFEREVRRNRQVARENRQQRDGVGTSVNTTSGWRNDDSLGIVVHNGECDECAKYAMHIFPFQFSRDAGYIGAKERRDQQIEKFWEDRAWKAQSELERAEDKIDQLWDRIRSLESQLEEPRHKRVRVDDTSVTPSVKITDTYAETVSKPPRRETDVVMKDAQKEFPPLPPSIHPPRDPSEANKRPQINFPPKELPENEAMFKRWSDQAQIEGNEVDLARARAYVRFANFTPPEKRTPLMKYALAEWHLPAWLPLDRQSGRGQVRAQDGQRLNQPKLSDPPEQWAQFMHHRLYMYKDTPGLVIDHTGISLPHLRGMLLTRQLLPPRALQRERSAANLRILEVLATPGLYRETIRGGRFYLSERDLKPMTQSGDNVSVDDVISHLAACGVEPYEVDDARAYADSWLSTATRSDDPNQSRPAKDILARVRTCSDNTGKVSPMQPTWWSPPPGAISLSAAKKRKRAPSPRRAVAVPPTGPRQRTERPTDATVHIPSAPTGGSPSCPTVSFGLTVPPKTGLYSSSSSRPFMVGREILIPQDVSPEELPSEPYGGNAHFDEGGYPIGYYDYDGPTFPVRTKADKNRDKCRRRNERQRLLGTAPSSKQEGAPKQTPAPVAPSGEGAKKKKKPRNKHLYSDHDDDSDSEGGVSPVYFAPEDSPFNGPPSAADPTDEVISGLISSTLSSTNPGDVQPSPSDDPADMAVDPSTKEPGEV